MEQRVLIEALVQATRKRRILPKGPSSRLGEYAVQKGVRSLDDLRAWLAKGEGLSQDLARKVLEFLPPPELKAFGPYTALAHLADGGMGSVWLAGGPNDSLVVVKTLKNSLPVPASGTVGTEFMRRFEREAKITQQLKHPNVVHCIDNGVAPDGSMFMVLEYVDSGDLRDVVEARSGLSEALALAILYQVVDGLAEAHRFKLVHRDIKPPNIFVSGDGTAKLADFGIARSTEEQRTMLTMQGAIVGSPLYMSPEQVLTDPTLDIRSDIYAMGAVLYFCIAAQAPYDGKLQEILHKHCTAPVPDVRKKRPSISDKTQNIIATCMAKERKARYADPQALRAAIAEALVGLGLKPGAKVDEDTVDADGPPRDTSTPRPSGLGDDRTIAANLNDAADKTISANLNDLDATMASDLNNPDAPAPSTGVRAQMPTVLDNAGFDEIKTMTANLLSEEVASGLADAYAKAQGRPKEPGTQATLVVGNSRPHRRRHRHRARHRLGRSGVADRGRPDHGHAVCAHQGGDGQAARGTGRHLPAQLSDRRAQGRLPAHQPSAPEPALRSRAAAVLDRRSQFAQRHHARWHHRAARHRLRALRRGRKHPGAGQHRIVMAALPAASRATHRHRRHRRARRTARMRRRHPAPLRCGDHDPPRKSPRARVRAGIAPRHYRWARLRVGVRRRAHPHRG
jgi:serine/threonine protein kinase